MMVNRGWRRSGSYIYQSVFLLAHLLTPRGSSLALRSPDMARTCCPQYTIRLDESQFRPGKQLRRVLARFNRYVLTGSDVLGGGKSVPRSNHSQGFPLTPAS